MIHFHYPEWSIRWKVQFQSTEKLLPFESVSGEREYFPRADIRFFFNIGLPIIARTFSKKYINERISFPLNRKSVATGRNKGFV